MHDRLPSQNRPRREPRPPPSPPLPAPRSSSTSSPAAPPASTTRWASRSREIYGQNIADARVQVQATKASVENLNLLQQGKGELAFSLGDSVKLAWDGDAEVGFAQPLDKLRGIAAIYPNYIQIVATADSGITDLEGLKGKGLSVGAPKSGTELNARAIFEAAGMSYDDLGKTEYLPFAESVELMKNRQLDATLQSAGLGVASIKDLAASVPISMVAVPPEIIEKLGAPYVAVTIPAGTYEGQEADVPTAAVINFLVTHDGVSEETVYQMTKLLFENLRRSRRRTSPPRRSTSTTRSPACRSRCTPAPSASTRRRA